MKKLFLLVIYMFVLGGCSFTSFDEDKPVTTYKRIMTPSGMQQERELPMGQIGFQSTPNQSDFVKIEIKDQHVIGRVHESQEHINPNSVRAKPKTEITNAHESVPESECDTRDGKQCVAFKRFPLYSTLEDVPESSIGEIMTCRVQELEDSVFSCKKNMAECFSAKLGEYCIKEQ